MSSGFLLADALSKVLRKPYHKGDVAISVNYLVEGIKIGPYRVMLKRNFDTACWIPPVGKRTSHSIYYGDRMVARVLERFVKLHDVEMPDTKEFVAEVKAQLEAEKEAYELAKEAIAKASPAKAKRMTLPKTNPMSAKTRVLDAQLNWLHDNTAEEQWELFGEWLHKAIMSYGRHERSHARHTPQDMKQVNRDLKILGIPFKYFNLFEDARIEHIDRQDQGMPFEWMMFEELAPANHPMNIFLRCIQLEGEQDVGALESEEPFKEDPARTIGHIAESVETYYKRACACTSAEALYPIITEFLEEFKEELPPESEDGEGEGDGEGGSGSGTPGSGSGKGKKKGSSDDGDGDEDDDEDSGAGERAGDLSTAAEASDMGDEFFNDFDSDADIVGGTDPEGAAAEAAAKDELKPKKPLPKGRGNPGGPGSGIPDSFEPSESGNAATEDTFLAHTAGRMDETYRKRVENLVGMLLRMFKSHTLPAAMETPAQRLSGRHLAHGELRWLHKKVFGGKGKRKWVIVYDCSGSMGGRPDREGKLLLLALNELARRGFLEGRLILSGCVGRPVWLSYEFPMKEEIILRIQTNHGAEGLQAALKGNVQHIKNVDDVFVMTDANITDAPINREFFAKQRIWPVGLYVGSEEAGEMQRHFPQNVIRDTIEQVVEAMLTRNRRTVG